MATDRVVVARVQLIAPDARVQVLVEAEQASLALLRVVGRLQGGRRWRGKAPSPINRNVDGRRGKPKTGTRTIDSAAEQTGSAHTVSSSKHTTTHARAQ